MKKILFTFLLFTLGINQTGGSMQAKIETTKGEILIELEFEKTPMTVANFVGLAEGTIENDAKPLGEPYYDGIKLSYCEVDWVEFDDNDDSKLTKEEVEDSIQNRMSTHWEGK